MPTINGKVCVVNGTPVDKVFSDGKQVYGRNMFVDSGFESGQTPANNFWSDNKSDNRLFIVNHQQPSLPKPFGNYMLQIENDSTDSSLIPDQYVTYRIPPVMIKKGETWTYSYYYATAGSAAGKASDYLIEQGGPIYEMSMQHDSRDVSGGQTTWHRFVKTWTANRDATVTNLRFGFVKTSASQGWLCIDNIKLEKGSIATPYSPAPEDVLN